MRICIRSSQIHWIFLFNLYISSALGLAGAVAAKSAIGGIGGIGLGGIGGIGGIGGGHGGPQPYGPSYGYGPSVPTSVQSAPISYFPSQSYVPPPPPPPPVQPIQTVQQIQPVPIQQIQAAPIQAAPVQTIQPAYGQPSYSGPLSAALAWKSGLVSGITNTLSNGIVGLRPPVAAAPAYSYAPAPTYSYAPAPAPVVSAPILSTPGTDIPVAPIAQVAPAAVASVPNPNKPVYVVCENQ